MTNKNRLSMVSFYSRNFQKKVSNLNIPVILQPRRPNLIKTAASLTFLPSRILFSPPINIMCVFMEKFCDAWPGWTMWGYTAHHETV